MVISRKHKLFLLPWGFREVSKELGGIVREHEKISDLSAKGFIIFMCLYNFSSMETAQSGIMQFM